MYNLSREFAFCNRYLHEVGIETSPHTGIMVDDIASFSDAPNASESNGLCLMADDSTYMILLQEGMLDERHPLEVVRSVIMHELLHTNPRYQGAESDLIETARMIREKSGGLYNLISTLSPDCLRHPEKPIAVSYSCECGSVEYMTNTDPYIELIDSQPADARDWICSCCGREIDPASKRKVRGYCMLGHSMEYPILTSLRRDFMEIKWI